MMTAKQFIEMLKEANWNGSKLPNNLTVDGELYLRNTNITSLPTNLKVGCWLRITSYNVCYTKLLRLIFHRHRCNLL